MKALDLKSNDKKVFVVYGGRFQPPTMGHFEVYKKLTDEFGKKNVWIATSDSTDRENFGKTFTRGPRKDEVKQVVSPFDFEDKKALWKMLFGVDNVVNCKSPTFEPVEIASKYDEDWAFVMAVGTEDVKRYTVDKDWLPYTSDVEAGQNYYYEVPMINRSEYSGTNVRENLSVDGVSDTQTKRIFKKLYGKWNQRAFEIIMKRLRGDWGDQ